MFKGNKIYIVDKNGNKKRFFGFIPGLNIRFKGKNSVVELYEPLPKFSGCRIKMLDSSTFIMKSSKDKIHKLHVLMDSNQICRIGSEFFTFGCEIVYSSEPNLSVNIGNDCLFAKDIIIRPSDGHKIYDKETNEIKNIGKSIDIGNHIWVAGNTAILKGVKIHDDCVIGLGSIVTKSTTEPNAVYAGNPAKLVKRNINWKK